ncbi:MAG: hypothetical protein B6D39_02685 [Anaerolineae bacterium UTCFX2]|jgi:hypothetical protein|nr:hypothetical protein [Anaerolineae bacterium]MCZ7553232.1 hypothetical protein [Anaerolineales bacterium]OQY93703.1 MAG: hypothetical protein B6D39_02685 [Anaerolineae bacterium UTCFX2]
MSWRVYFLLGLFGFLLACAISAAQHSPGYMDADYYYSGGLRLAQGRGFSEQLLWNYLDDPAGLPHPSHGYWMPLTSILAAGGMALLNRLDFFAARLPFILIAGLIPPLTAALAWRLARRKNLAILAGAFALFSGFYLPYVATTDIFGAYMLLGGVFFLLVPAEAGAAQATPPRTWINFAALGLIAGLMHLARADGMIWLVTALAAVWLYWLKHKQTAQPGSVWLNGLACAAGYLLVMLPWFARNLAEFGTFLSPGGSRALWIREYDELFSFPASQLTLARWWGGGLGAILRTRLWAFGQNLLSTLAVQAEIFLAPLILLGMWRLRADLRTRLAALAWALTFLAMTLPFPFQGVRGGFFHSGSALQPFFWAAAPVGLERLLEFGSRLRGWRMSEARRFFAIGLVALAVCLSAFVTYNRLFSAGSNKETWDASNRRYAALESYLRETGAAPAEVVMVNNSPGYFAAAGRPAVSIPFGDTQTVCAAAQRYNAGFLLLEIDQIKGGADLFAAPGDRLCLRYLATFEDVRLFEITLP